MEERVKIYIWLSKSDLEVKNGKLKLEYGHVAMSVPWCPEVSEAVKEPYPLYISFHGNGHFIDKQRDTEYWEGERNCYLEEISLPCTKGQAAKLWKSFLSMKDPQHADKDSFEQRGRYYIPYRHSAENTFVYPITFNHIANREDNNGSHNCTTLIFKLLHDAEVKLPGDPGSSKCQKRVTGGLQLLNGGAVGYNISIAVEICEACLPEEAKHIKNIAIVSFVLMGAAFLAEIFCIPRIFEQKNCITQQTDQHCLQPRSVIKSLPILMLLINLVLVIVTAIIHGQYHTLFDGASGIGSAVGLGVGIGALFCVLGSCRSFHHDAHTFVTRPEALLNLLGRKRREINVNDRAIQLEETSETNTTDQNDTLWRPPLFSQASKETSSIALDLYPSKRSSSDEDSDGENSRTDFLSSTYNEV